MRVSRFTERPVITPVASAWVLAAPAANDRTYLRFGLNAGVTAVIVCSTKSSGIAAQAQVLFPTTGAVQPYVEYNEFEKILTQQEFWIAMLSVGMASPSVTVTEVFEEESGTGPPGRSGLYMGNGAPLQQQVNTDVALATAVDRMNAILLRLRQPR